MQNQTKGLDHFLTWAEKKETIRGVILTGSRAGKSGSPHRFSDYDVAMFGNNFDFIKDDGWLNEFRKFWVCIHDQFQLLETEIPTRLVLFNNELKVDFSFLPIKILNAIIAAQELPDEFNIGYTILLDKDNLLRRLPAPAFRGFGVKRPCEAAFGKNVDEFWFEVFHVAKYLSRNDLWTAKFRDFSTKALLLQMLQWNQGSKREWAFSPKPNGKEMKEWIDTKTWERLHSCFGSFDSGNSWKVLESTVQLYRDVALETSILLHYTYNQSLDVRITKFIKQTNVLPN
jgi:aminoglycoside 6-adenylyltransferase